MMFVEQQVQLIERRPRHLPVVFLVQVAQRHGVRKELVEIFDALFADALGQGDRQLDDVPEWLDLVRVLMRERLGPVQDRVYVDQSFCHRLLPVRRPVTRSNLAIASPVQVQWRRRRARRSTDASLRGLLIAVLVAVGVLVWYMPRFLSLLKCRLPE